MPGPQASRALTETVLSHIKKYPTQAHCATTVARDTGLKMRRVRDALARLYEQNRIVLTNAPAKNDVQASALWYRAPGLLLEIYWPLSRPPVSQRHEEARHAA